MAILEKLCIRGIRSFGPEEEEQVRFTTPLTLFLGQNGCGKTTIIESIKFALTGDLPAGTGAGSGFVNDPKLSNKNFTKGYVKVKFTDGKGDKITVAKFVEVRNNNGKLTFKNMNPTVRWEDAKNLKQPEDISGRCADIDAYCAQKLNVSKAILNNVIFCHQENSAWPLDEGKKLKEKFDEIFGATEYNNLVDKLRKEIKDRKTQLKLTKEQLKVKEEVKKNAEKLKDKLGVQEGLLESKKEEIQEKKDSLEPLDKRYKEILEVEQVLGSLHTKLSGLKKTYEGIIQHQQSIQKHLDKEFEGTDRELNDEIANFKDQQGIVERDILEKEQKKETIESKLTAFSKDLQSKQVRFGQLKAEEDQYKKRCEERDCLIEKAKVKCSVQGETVSEVLDALKKHISDIEERFSNLETRQQSEERKLQQKIDETRAQHASAKASLESKEKIIEDLNKTITDIKHKLARLKISDSQVKIIDDRITQTKERLEKRKADFDEYAVLSEIDEMKEEIQGKEQTLNKLEREHRTLQQNFVAEQNIDRENSAILEIQGEIADIQSKHKANFEALFKDDMPKENFEQSVKSILNREDSKFKKLAKSISDNEKKLSALEASVKHAQEKLDGYREELRVNEKKVQQVCQGKYFSEALDESYNRKEKLTKDKGTYRSCNIMYEAFINQLKQEQCCPVCETGFSNQKEKVTAIVHKLKTKIEEIPRKMTEVERDLKKEEELYNKLQQLKPISDMIDSLKNGKIPAIEQELEQTKEKRDETAMELAMLKSELDEPQSLLEICRKVISDATLLDRLSTDLQKSRDSVERLKASLVQVPSNRTLEETEAEIRNVKADVSNLRKKLETKKDVFDQTKDAIQALNASLQVEVQKQLEAQKLLQEKPLLDKQLKDSTTQKNKVEQELGALKESVKTLKAELQEHEKQKESVVKQNRKVLEEQRSEVEAKKRVVEAIENVNSVIRTYEAGDAQTKMAKVVDEINSHKEKISKLEETKDTLNNYVSQKKQELASQESRLRALNDNKELREYKKKAEAVKSDIDDMEKQIGGHNYRSLYDEKTRVEESMASIRREIDTRKGACKQISELIDSYTKELNKRENKMAYKEYMIKYYDLKTNELAIGDLETYTVNLEKAVLMFHKERMVQINKTIRDLWRTIYKGNDIDYIEIQTEDTVGTARRRTYSYKVVEVKKGVELEMRGRCSAGQRVLACLVIRMALAETFSGSCGILALDEPTTNLDRDNIISLSDALSKIITAREKQKSFQLLVITHDEDFLTTLTRDQSVSSYYRVQRNPDGFSEIVRQIL